MPIEINTDTIAEAVVARLTEHGVMKPRLLTLEQAATLSWMSPNIESVPQPVRSDLAGFTLAGSHRLFTCQCASISMS